MVTEWVGDTRARVILHDVKPDVAEVLAELFTAVYRAGRSDEDILAMAGEPYVQAALSNSEPKKDQVAAEIIRESGDAEGR